MSFGIPIQSIPVTYEGELKTATHLQWLARRRLKESVMRLGESFEGIDLPSPKDVLFGRGKTNQEHSGNIIMRGIVAECVPEYRLTTRAEKGEMPLKILLQIKEGGGRFLKRNTDHGWWYQVSDEEAQEKLSMSLRSANCAGSLRADTCQQEVSVRKPFGVHFDQYAKRLRLE